MSDSSLWFGYLEAGAKSSPVVLDERLNTANPETVYLFNLQRGAILEYTRAIVDPKLRPLADGEGDPAELERAFNRSRQGFVPRGSRVIKLDDHRPAATAADEDEDDGYEGFSDADWAEENEA